MHIAQSGKIISAFIRFDVNFLVHMIDVRRVVLHHSLPATCLLLLLPVASAAHAQTAAHIAETQNHTSSIPSPNTLVDGTPVKLILAQTVSSASAKTGQQVLFEVSENVRVGGVTVIAKGANALAIVTAAEHRKSMGRGGKLDINVQSVRLVDNEKVPLRATAGGKAGGHVGVMTTAMVATGILFFPAAPLFLFIHGKDISLPKGLETVAFINGDTNFNLPAITSQGAVQNTAGANEVPAASTLKD